MLASRLNKLLSGAWRPQRRHLNLALQGGGAHGAFTWGVLDQLLEDARIVIGGVSGTSAGAVNAALFAASILAGRYPAIATAITQHRATQTAEIGRAHV